tara:strand:+ start:48 stop:485 length:438 start_codon:yes stop_codon:yes gene_type:complete
MKLSTRCRYAAIALFDMAYHSANTGTQVRQIAERQNIPMRFLEQIFQDLRRAHLVNGKRGRNGGYVLAKEPDQITLLDIVLATDGPFGFASKQEDAPVANVPNLFWGQIAEEVSTVFAQYSLKDLVDRALELGIPRGEPGYMYFI